jgi:hypothetical protein
MSAVSKVRVGGGNLDVVRGHSSYWGPFLVPADHQSGGKRPLPSYVPKSGFHFIDKHTETLDRYLAAMHAAEEVLH